MKQKKQVLGKMTHDIKPAINEANEIAKQLNQNVTFSFSLISAGTNESHSGEKVDSLLKARKEQIEIRVDDFINDQMYMWSPNKFKERLIVMRDLLSTYEDKGELPDLEPADNPFFDAPQPQLIGEGYYILQPLANLIDNPAQINLIGRTFEVFGKLNVNVIPVDQTGSEDLPDEMIPDEPEDLIDTRIDYVV